MKIKTIKKMTLPELIQWGLGKGIKHKEFTGSRNGIVEFNFIGWVRTDLIEPDETFEVEVEEEVTEETVIPKLIEFCCDDYDSMEFGYFNIETKIKDMKDQGSIAFYMLNDDMTMTLIWKNGEMVE
ncbi:hypothetical protein [Staphylococcus agnetis]|uniref:hypothetical protein n=1 Tax=Staphylococcus agnetis TaxID=985762 RepID=UPI0039E7DD8E